MEEEQVEELKIKGDLGECEETGIETETKDSHNSNSKQQAKKKEE